MTDILITADELRQWAEPIYDYPRDADGNVKMPGRVWDQARCDLATAGDQLDLNDLEKLRAA